MANNPVAEVDVSALLDGTVKVNSTVDEPSQSDLQIWQLVETGLLVTEVADMLDIEVQTVKRSIKRIEKAILAGLVVNAASLKMQQHLRLETVYREALAAFKESSGRKVKTTVKNGTKGAEQTVTETEETGDPRYLTLAIKALADQRDIWPGANAPKAQAITGPTGEEDPEITLKVEDMKPEQIRKLAGLLDQIEEITGEGSLDTSDASGE